MGLTLLDGFWFGLGILLSFGAVLIFCAIVTLITAFISYLIDKSRKG